MLQQIFQWKHHNFSVNQFSPEDFNHFSRDFKSYMRNICESIKAELVSYDTGNFTVSIIMRRKDAQMVKIELSDVRRSKNFDMVLIRTFPGGDEEYPSRSTLAHLEDLSNSISKL